MNRPRRGASRPAGARGRALAAALAVGFSSALPAGALAGQGTRPQTVRFRFLLASLVYNAPLRGSFTASGAIVDHGTASGLIWPVYHKFPDGVGLSALWLSLHVTGAKGSFSYRARVAITWFPVVSGFSDRGPVVVTAASGAYRRLAPIAYMRAVTDTRRLTRKNRDIYLRSQRFVIARLLDSPSTSPGRKPRRR